MSGRVDATGSAARVACVIATHRRPAFLREALHSALAQTRAPDEIFVADDETGSAEVAALVDEAAKRAPLPVRYVVHGEGRGPSTSRNAGARATRAEWLAFLDDDDRWLPRYLERALACPDADLVLTARWDCDERDARTPGKSPPAEYREAEWLRRNPGATGSSTLIRRGLFEAIGGFDARLYSGEDRDLILRAMRAGARYAAVSERLLLHRDAGPRLTRDARTLLPARLRFLWKHRGAMSARDVGHMLRKIYRQTRRASWRAHE